MHTWNQPTESLDYWIIIDYWSVCNTDCLLLPLVIEIIIGNFNTALLQEQSNESQPIQWQTTIIISVSIASPQIWIVKSTHCRIAVYIRGHIQSSQQRRAQDIRKPYEYIPMCFSYVQHKCVHMWHTQNPYRNTVAAGDSLTSPPRTITERNQWMPAVESIIILKVLF